MLRNIVFVHTDLFRRTNLRFESLNCTDIAISIYFSFSMSICPSNAKICQVYEIFLNYRIGNLFDMYVWKFTYFSDWRRNLSFLRYRSGFHQKNAFRNHSASVFKYWTNWVTRALKFNKWILRVLKSSKFTSKVLQTKMSILKLEFSN